jgi:hypothetical protein
MTLTAVVEMEDNKRLTEGHVLKSLAMKSVIFLKILPRNWK